jgi:cyanophycinase
VYYHYGSPADFLPAAPLTGGLALEGGGTDVDAVYQWMGAKAGGGDFLVLGTSGKDAYDPYIYNLNRSNPSGNPYGGRPLNSVSTLVISSSAGVTNSASISFITSTIQHAEAIFIEGGDQSTYVNLWQNTPVTYWIQDAVANRHVPIGGTSAGLAVLGQFNFSAQNGSALSSTVLANPYDRTVTLDQGFLSLPYMNSVITDSHFYERDRMGRLDVFMARLVTDGWSSPTGTKGIGIDEQTALLVDTTTGDAQVVANPSTDPNARHVYFLQTTGAPQVCQPGTPLTYTYDTLGTAGISVHRAGVGDTFNLGTWTETGGTDWADYTLLAVNGVLSSTQPNQSIY